MWCYQHPFQCHVLEQHATCPTVHGNPDRPPTCPNLTLSFGNRLMVLRGRSTRRTRRDLIVLMSFPLLLPLWRDVRVRRREEREQKSVWVVGGPQLHVTTPTLSGLRVWGEPGTVLPFLGKSGKHSCYVWAQEIINRWLSVVLVSGFVKVLHHLAWLE